MTDTSYLESYTVGDCNTDMLTVTSPCGATPPTICGYNTGQHIWVPAGICCFLFELPSCVSLGCSSLFFCFFQLGRVELFYELLIFKVTWTILIKKCANQKKQQTISADNCVQLNLDIDTSK